MPVARLFLPIHPLSYHDLSDDPLADATRYAAYVAEKAEQLARLQQRGWTPWFHDLDDGIADFEARKEFASVEDALAEAADAGATGHMLEWPGEDEYHCVEPE